MAYSIDPSSNGCYPGTNILINKHNIRNQQQLDENETLITSVKTLQFELEPFTGDPDFLYLKNLHRFLFGELYDWAGEVRQINLSKLHTSFCPVGQIEDMAGRVF